MPPILSQRTLGIVDRWVDFSLFGLASSFIVCVFFVGDVLMSARLVARRRLGHLRPLAPTAICTRATANYRPRVAVLIPAYNEEKVIERTVRSALESDYPNLRVIVIDDGSSDRTRRSRARSLPQEEIADGRVTVLTKPNAGKADALNYALEHVSEEFFVGIDADTVIAPDAISHLVPHFARPHV